MSITFTETSIDETNKTQQKVRGSKFMFKMSTIHANTCIQTTTPLRNRWWFRWQCPVLVLRSYTSWNQGLRSTVTITGIQFCWICFCRISALFSVITTFFSKMEHRHIVHVTLSPCCRERRQSLALQRCGHLICQIWIRWTTASGVCFKRGSTVRGSMTCRTWKNVCWGSGGCWTTPSLRSCLNACVRVNGGHFEHKFWASDFCYVLFVSSILVSVNVIDINVWKLLILVWNVLPLCLKLSHGMVATWRMYCNKFLRQWLWHSLVKLCMKNYENPSIFVKVTAKKSVAPLFLDTV